MLPKPVDKLPSSRIWRLDVLRAVAIGLVVMIHFYWSIRSELPHQVDHFCAPIFAWGVNGVPLFFLISGFCIHISFLKSGMPSTRDFYWRRFTRIYPAYFVSLLFFTVLAIFKILGTINAKQVLLHVFFIHNFFPAPVFYGINAPYWSLAVEFQFYLLYPLLLILRHKYGLKNCLTAAFLLSLGYTALCLKYPLISATISNPTIVPDWYGWIMGACMAEAYVEGRLLFPWKGWFVTMALILMITYYCLHGWDFIQKLSVYLFFGALMQNYLNWRNPLVWWERTLIPLGVVSYSVYLWHYPFLKLVHSKFADALHVPGSLLWQTAVYLPLTVLCLTPFVVISYFLFERRAMNWMRRWKST